MESSTLMTDGLCLRFSLDEILSSTQNFDISLVVGCGGFGRVYRGQIDDSSNFVAIKRLVSFSRDDAHEFLAEVRFISKLRHRNLASLIGYCDERSEMALVYEYASQGTLADHLHTADMHLSWLQRLKICIGAAHGLDYLHTGTGRDYGIIHRDVKSSNILLDENFVAKVSDFGLSKIIPRNQTNVSTDVQGTFGYLDPQYFYSGKLTRKSDVYAFGVVLLEVICGRPAVDSSLDDEAHWGLVGWAQDNIRRGKFSRLIDYRIRGQISSKCLTDFVLMASHCLHGNPLKRPTMAQIVSELQSILSKQERPDPFWSFIDRVRNLFSSKGESNSSSLILAPVPQHPITPSEGVSNMYSYDVLKRATSNFSPDSILGEDSHGLVYKGWIHELSLAAAKPGNGIPVAIKRLEELNLHHSEKWLAQINILGQLDHPNIVKLIGVEKGSRPFIWLGFY